MKEVVSKIETVGNNITNRQDYSEEISWMEEKKPKLRQAYRHIHRHRHPLHTTTPRPASSLTTLQLSWVDNLK